MMRRKLFVIIFLIYSSLTLSICNVSAQNNISLRGDTLILNNNVEFWINEEITFGAGSMPNRDYSYIYEAPNDLQKLISSHKRKLLTPGFKGFSARIVKFEKEIGHNKKNYTYDVIVLETPNGNRYWCNVANAYASNEIVIKSAPQVAKAEPVTPNDTKDVNEQLKQLKWLLDNGKISKQEYDARRKKILGSQSTTSKKAKTSKAKPISVF